MRELFSRELDYFTSNNTWWNNERYASGGDFGDIYILLLDSGGDWSDVAGGIYEPDKQGQCPNPYGGHHPVRRVLLAAVVVCMDAPVASFDNTDMEGGMISRDCTAINNSGGSEGVGGESWS